MDPTLRRLLDTWGDSSDPLTGLETFRRELSRLSLLSPDEFDEKLSVIRGDVDQLAADADLAAEQADRIARAHRQAQELAETLEELRNFAGGGVETRPLATGDEREGHRLNTAPSGSTTEKVLGVMRQNPYMSWTPQAVYDQLRCDGGSTSRTNVQTTLQRLAASGRLVQRITQGKYQLVASPQNDASELDEPLTAPLATAGEQPTLWVADDVLDRVAADAADRFLVQHPGEAERSFLVEEAKRRVAVWTERHDGREPDDEGHARRLMKSALNDFHKRQERKKRPPYLRVIEQEVTL